MRYLTLFVMLLTGCAQPLPPSMPEAYSLFPSVVALVQEDGSVYCSGVSVSATQVLTAGHCMQDYQVGESVLVARQEWLDDATPAANQYRRAEILHLDHEVDLALLRFRNDTFVPVAVDNARVDMEVVVIGHPAGIPYVANHGRVSGDAHSWPGEDLPRRWFFVDAGVIGGMSGGPVIDRWGHVVGIVSFTLGNILTTQAHLGGCIPADTINQFIQEQQ